MSKLIVSVVEYLNTAPLVWGFTDGPLKGRYELSFTVPSLCAEELRGGRADVAIIPTIEYQRTEGVVLLPGMAVAAKHAVRSILVVAKRPIEFAKRIALDRSSRSSAALVRLLAAEYWGVHPEYVQTPPDASAMLSHADAALVIGDAALRIAVKMDALAEKRPSGEFCCQGDKKQFPVAGHDTLFIYDVAHEWREWTGLPCVLALWAARRDRVTPEVVDDFLMSKAYGLEHIRDIAEAASIKLELPPDALEAYLRHNVNYSLDEENRAGLELYFEKCARAGLIPRVKPLEFVATKAAAAKEVGSRG